MFGKIQFVNKKKDLARGSQSCRRLLKKSEIEIFSCVLYPLLQDKAAVKFNQYSL